jgi:hypothetical protein
MRKSAIIALVLIAGAPFGLWGASFIDPAPAQDNCPFKSVSHGDFLRLLAQARALDWTVWPGLSKGIFEPSDSWFAGPSQYFEHSINERLLRSIKSLTFDHTSADAQLAAAHAVMRSMNAEFVSVLEANACNDCAIPAPRQVFFRYFIPQRRFAPLCLPCFLWRYTTIGVYFYQDARNDGYFLDHVIVLNADLKYDPQKEQERNATCPELPSGTNG